MAKTMTSNSQGGWFRSGYHGHFRNKVRYDFNNEFRHEAKPTPPEKFIRRIKDRPTAHNFSHHDNRFSHQNTVDAFQGGLGKRRIVGRFTGKYRPNFISWVPHRKEIQESGPTISLYRHDFSEESNRSERVPQMLTRTAVRRPYTAPLPYDTDEDDLFVSTYQLAHRHKQPNPRVTTNVCTGRVDPGTPTNKTFQYADTRSASLYDRPKTSIRRPRLESTPISTRSGVAACMSWSVVDAETVGLNLRQSAPAALAATRGGDSAQQTMMDSTQITTSLPATSEISISEQPIPE